MLRAVGPQGAGNEAAGAAWQEVARSDAAELPKLLSALDGANPLAANWIRTAIDAICERTLRRGRSLPQTSLEQFVLETALRRAGDSPTSGSFRSTPRPKSESCRSFFTTTAWSFAATRSHGSSPRPEVNKQAGGNRGLVEKGGWMRHATATRSIRSPNPSKSWTSRPTGPPRRPRRRLVGNWPLRQHGREGLRHRVRSREGFDPQAEHQGKHGPVRWRRFSSDSPNGQVDLNKALADGMEKEKEREIVGYAAAEFHSPEARPFVHIRTASDNMARRFGSTASLSTSTKSTTAARCLINTGPRQSSSRAET